jgi:hypothetical protein
MRSMALCCLSGKRVVKEEALSLPEFKKPGMGMLLCNLSGMASVKIDTTVGMDCLA